MSSFYRRALPVMFYITISGFFLGIAAHQSLVFIFFLWNVFDSLKNRKPFGRPIFGNLQATLLLSSILLSAFWTTYAYYDRGSDISFHWAFLAFWIFDKDLQEEFNWDTLVKVMMVMALPGMIRGLFWLFQPDEIRWALKVGFTHYPRSFGFNSNPITHTEGMIVLVCWLLGRLTYPLSDKQQKVSIGIVVFVLLLITLSRVRSGWVAFAAICLLHVWNYKKHRKWIVWALVILIGGVLGTLFLFGFNSESISERFELMRRGWYLFINHPILGIGPERFDQFAPLPNGLISHPHNTIMGIAVEMGLVGLACYLFFAVSMLVRSVQLFRFYRDKKTTLSWVTRSLMYITVAFWVFGLTDYNFGSTELLLLHALHWGLIARIPLKSGT